MAHPQHNFTSNFNGSEGRNAELTLNINGTEHKYTPAGNDKEFTVTGAVRINVNLDGSELVERITTVLGGDSLPLLVQQNLDGTEDSYTYVGLQDNEWLFGRATTTHIDSVGINITDGSVRRETLPLASDVAIVSNTDPAVYTKLRTAVALGHLPVLDYQGTYATYVTIDNNILKFATEAADPNVESYVYTVASDNTVTATPRNAGVVRADSVDTEPGTLVDKLEVVDNVRDPEDPDDPALLTLGVTVDAQGKRKVTINEDNLRNFIGDVANGGNSCGWFNSSHIDTVGNEESINVDRFRVSEGQTVLGNGLEFVPIEGDVESGAQFGNVYANAGIYFVSVRLTLLWRGNPVNKVCNVAGRQFDFSYNHEDKIIATNLMRFNSRTKMSVNISLESDIPAGLRILVDRFQIFATNAGTLEIQGIEAVEHNDTLTGDGTTENPLSVVVDNTLDADSENPVQNKVLYGIIGNVETLLEDL